GVELPPVTPKHPMPRRTGFVLPSKGIVPAGKCAMLTRRDLAAIAWYSVLFSAVIGWAALRNDGKRALLRDGGRRGHEIGPVDENDGTAHLRRAVSHMVTQ